MRKKCHGLIILAVIICVVVNYQVIMAQLSRQKFDVFIMN